MLLYYSQRQKLTTGHIMTSSDVMKLIISAWCSKYMHTIGEALEVVPRKSAVLALKILKEFVGLSFAMLQIRISHQRSAVCLVVLLCMCMQISRAEPSRTCANTVLTGQAQGQSHSIKGEIYDHLKDGKAVIAIELFRQCCWYEFAFCA